MSGENPAAWRYAAATLGLALHEPTGAYQRGVAFAALARSKGPPATAAPSLDQWMSGRFHVAAARLDVEVLVLTQVVRSNDQHVPSHGTTTYVHILARIDPPLFVGLNLLAPRVMQPIFGPSTLVLTGDPFFDDWFTLKATLQPEAAQLLRRMAPPPTDVVDHLRALSASWTLAVSDTCVDVTMSYTDDPAQLAPAMSAACVAAVLLGARRGQLPRPPHHEAGCPPVHRQLLRLAGRPHRRRAVRRCLRRQSQGRAWRARALRGERSRTPGDGRSRSRQQRLHVRRRPARHPLAPDWGRAHLARRHAARECARAGPLVLSGCPRCLSLISGPWLGSGEGAKDGEAELADAPHSRAGGRAGPLLRRSADRRHLAAVEPAAVRRAVVDRDAGKLGLAERSPAGRAAPARAIGLRREGGMRGGLVRDRRHRVVTGSAKCLSRRVVRPDPAAHITGKDAVIGVGSPKRGATGGAGPYRSHVHGSDVIGDGGR